MDGTDRSSTGDEAAELRSQLADLRLLGCLERAGGPEAAARNGDPPRSERSSLEARIEFIGDFDDGGYRFGFELVPTSQSRDF